MSSLDPGRQQKAREYARLSRRLWLITTVLGGAYALAWLLAGWSTTLRDWLLQRSPSFASPWLLVPAFAAIFGGLLFLIGLPLTFYGGFLLPHRFQQSNQSLNDWMLDQAKGLLVGLPIGLVLLELLYLALRATGDSWWIWAAAGLLAVNVLLSNLAPVLIMPLFNKYVPLGDEHADLAKRLLALAERAHTRVQGVFKFDMSRRTKSANAALAGLGNTRRIVLGDTLINEFTVDEIEAVLAHELGHHVHRDIPILIAFGTLSTAIGFFLASLGMQWAVGHFGLSGIGDVAGLPALVLVLGIYGLLTGPLDSSVSRWRESMADQYALEATGKNEAFASAFVRLANQNLSEVDPEKWVVLLFYSHPPLGDRIARAEAWKPSGR
jgi:Zn-dependent protease with chaperone function